ncbi:hypothetical protein FA95DRAFT_1542246, partial [Auriscalpium vulgare]
MCGPSDESFVGVMLSRRIWPCVSCTRFVLGRALRGGAPSADIRPAAFLCMSNGAQQLCHHLLGGSRCALSAIAARDPGDRRGSRASVEKFFVDPGGACAVTVGCDPTYDSLLENAYINLLPSHGLSPASLHPTARMLPMSAPQYPVAPLGPLREVAIDMDTFAAWAASLLTLDNAPASSHLSSTPYISPSERVEAPDVLPLGARWSPVWNPWADAESPMNADAGTGATSYVSLPRSLSCHHDPMSLHRYSALPELDDV